MGHRKKHKRSIFHLFRWMSGRSVLRSAAKSNGDGVESFPILMHTDQGPVVLKLAEDLSGDYNAWTVRGDLPNPPFPTEDLFCDSKYTLEPLNNIELTISGTQINLCVRDGTVTGGEIDNAETLMRWHEIGKQ